ncbi:AMP-binding protein [Natronorubrum sp. FCH18a]|uniref:class I adenylate-forming enzyme family protein n=1 Tax=Natronorubrum sp. FCH18a TaxID=3447018 RepID=UPI003F510B9B
MRINNELPPIKDLSAQNAAKSSDDIAFEDADGSVTWGEFERESLRAANGFLRYVNRGDRVAYYCNASVDHTQFVNGALKAGCIITNLHTNSSAQALRHCLTETRPRVVVVDESLADSFAEKVNTDVLRSVSTVVVLGEPTREYEESAESFLEGTTMEEPDVLVNEDDIVVIGWTSGSTGVPKGWCHTNRSMYLKGVELATRPGFDRTGQILTVNKPSFLVWFSLFTKSTLGAESMYYLRNWNPEKWLEVVEEKRITQSTLVPTMWREVLDTDPESYDLSSLEMITSTGEKLSSTTLRQLRDRICETVSQSYGSTEIHSTVLYNEELTEERIESVGKPQSGTEVRIIEPDGPLDEELPSNETGEIVVKSPDCPVWVWGDSEKTAEEFDQGWWRSGDLGYKDEEGYLYIEGRSDFMIKSKGVKIMPAPIEEALGDHPDVKNAIVVGVPSEEYGERVTAIIESYRDPPSESKLDQWCLESDKIADHERPRDYYTVESIEKTASGKIDRLETMDKLGLDRT